VDDKGRRHARGPGDFPQGRCSDPAFAEKAKRRLDYRVPGGR
jgi:hypothetical protein